MAALLAAGGADLGWADGWGRSALHLAVMYTPQAVVAFARRLVEGGADLEAVRFREFLSAVDCVFSASHCGSTASGDPG